MSAWVLSDGKAGDEQQCLGVVEALGVTPDIRRVAPRAPFSWLMPWGPIDPREAPTAVNTVATQRPHAWFERNVIATVPYLYPGGGRSVYPGFLQLAGFMAMNLGDHLNSHWEMFKHLVQGDGESAEASKAFYDEYRSVCDMTEEFYLQTVDVVFQRHLLPKGGSTSTSMSIT